MKVMAELLVWKTESLPGGLDGWAMNGVFRTGLKAAIMGELVVGVSWRVSVSGGLGTVKL